MKTKTFIAHCELLALLRTSQQSQPDAQKRLAEAFDCFTEQLSRAARLTKSPPDLLRLYAYLRLTFKHLKVGRKLPEEKDYYVEAALSCLETERRLLFLRIRFPAVDESSCCGKTSPNIEWTATQTDLMELISALHAAGAIRKADGRSVELKTLIRAFERFMNVTIRNPDRCRYATINRSLHLTKFLDRLREALIERSQR